MKLTVIEKRDELKGIKTFIFEPKGQFSWKAGQYLIYFLSHRNQDLRGKMRFFTISSSPFEKYPSITTRIEKTPSSFKKTLNKLKIGDEIEAKGPDGDFVIDSENKNIVFIAYGIGITPFRSILKQLEFENKPINAVLLYSNRNAGNILFKNELEKIQKSHPEFKISYFISPKRIEKKNIEEIKNYKNMIFYVSGPDPMVEVLEKALDDMGIPKDNQKYDYFSGYKNI